MSVGAEWSHILSFFLSLQRLIMVWVGGEYMMSLMP